MRKLLALAAIVGVGATTANATVASALEVAPATISAPAVHRCYGDQTVFVWYPNMPRCNPDKGDTLNVGFYGSDGVERPKFRRWCNDAGGWLRWSYRRDAFVCHDVDF